VDDGRDADGENRRALRVQQGAAYAQRAPHRVVAYYRVASRPGVLDQATHLVRRHTAVFVQVAGVSFDDAVGHRVGQGGQDRHAARAYAQGLPFAGVCGQDLYRIAADL